MVGDEEVPLEPFFDESRLQYNSTAIVTHLDTCYAALAGRDGGDPFLLGVAAEDLYIPILTFVFGEAQLNGRVGVVSYHRLQNEKYGLPPNADLLHARLAKEALHELGHLLGLVHCRSYECVMHISTYVEDIDGKGERFCRECSAEVTKWRERE